MTEENNRFRFGGVERLYGREGLQALCTAQVAVIGLGGVGSWVVESLARSGVGHLLLVDFDDVCLSNTNRQIHALASTVGRPKAAVLAERCTEINPAVAVDARSQFFTARNIDEILRPGIDVVIDALDDVKNKCLLLAECRRRGITILSSGGAGGRRNPSRIEVADLARTHGDPLLSSVRKRLRQEYGFPAERRRKWRIPCVFSPEPPVYPASDGTVCAQRESGAATRLNCEGGFGTATFITGSFGFQLAALAARMILEKASVGAVMAEK